MDRPRDSKTWTRRHATALAGIGIAISLAALAGFASLRTGTLVVDPGSLRFGEVEHRPFSERVTATGLVRPQHLVFLETLAGGRIEEIYLREGSELAVGEPILRLVNPDLELEVQRLEERHSLALANLRNTRLLIDQSRRDAEQRLLEIEHRVLVKSKDLKIQQELFEQQLTPRRELDKAADEHGFWLAKKDLVLAGERRDAEFRATQVEQAEDTVERRRRNLETAQRKLDKLWVRAPIRGRLTSLDAEIGKTKAPGERLGQIDAGDFEIQAEVDQAYATRIGLDQSAGLELFDGNARHTFDLRVIKIYEEVRAGKLNLDLAFSSAPPTDLKRGQRVTLRIALGGSALAAVLPIGPFYQTTAGRWVFVVDPSGRNATRRTVRFGRRNEESYEVLAGLEPGERVIISRYDRFGEAERLSLDP